MKPALIIFCLFLTACDQLPHGSLSRAEATHYQLVSDKDGNAWRLDTNSGELKRCWQGTPGIQAPSCFTARQQ